MLSKCLWKLHQRSDGRKSSIKVVQNSLSRAVELTPRRRDPNRQDPVLDPIYKTVIITHKLVSVRKELDAVDGATYINQSLDMQKQFDASKRPVLAECTSWDGYVLELLKLLRTADKAKWHHRFVIHAAQLMQSEEVSQKEGAVIAKDYLAEQHIFSPKTMALSVWKTETERPGRHFVYSSRYCAYLIKLFEATSDLEAIQMLTKRVRKKSSEFYEHTKLWKQTFMVHVRVSIGGGYSLFKLTRS